MIYLFLTTATEVLSVELLKQQILLFFKLCGYLNPKSALEILFQPKSLQISCLLNFSTITLVMLSKFNKLIY